MTISELIARLSVLPQDTKVQAYEENLSDYDTVVEVEYNPKEAEPVVRLVTAYGKDQE